MAFTTYDPSANTLASLVSAIFTSTPAATTVGGSISVRAGTPFGEASAISFYNGSIAQLNIGGGLLLTTGDPTPPEQNTSGGYSVDTGTDFADPDLQSIVTAAFGGAGTVTDTTFLQFTINVTDPAVNGLRFDVVFASDEYPEWSDSSFVDIAGVFVNGTNYALFNGNPLEPLSVLEVNVASNFRNNEGTGSENIPIEYDGVSVKLQVTAPLQMGENVIKIGVADTGDSILDSALFVSGMQAVNYVGFGLSQQVSVTGTAQDTPGNQTYLGNDSPNVVTILSGQDVVDGAGGLDSVIYGFGLAGIDLSGSSWDGQRLRLQNGQNVSEVVNVERVTLAGDNYFALDTSYGGSTFGAFALLRAALDAFPPMVLLSQWVAHTDDVLATGGYVGGGGDLYEALLGDVAQDILQTYVPLATNEQVIEHLIETIYDFSPDAGLVAFVASRVGAGEQFETMGDLYAYASLQPENIEEMAAFVGSIQPLDISFF